MAPPRRDGAASPPESPTMAPHQRFGTLLLAAAAVLPGGLAAEKAAKAPIRVGIVGIDNYQALAFTELFRAPRAAGDLAGIRVVAAFPRASKDIAVCILLFSRWLPEKK